MSILLVSQAMAVCAVIVVIGVCGTALYQAAEEKKAHFSV